jgi:uncharacterized membrane protein (Fun14 family)
MAKKQNDNGQQTRRDRWFLLLVLGLFVVGLSIRGYGYLTHTTTNSRTFQHQVSRDASRKAFSDPSTQQRVPRPDQDSEENRGLVVDLAPYLTEGGLSFFLGFCIGYFLRLVAKTAILIVGAIYFGLILLSHYGMITVDWGSFQDALQHLLLNTQTHIAGLRDIITISLPSVAMGGLGIWRGLKKP